MTSLGEGGGPGGRKCLKIQCWRHLFGHCTEGPDCSAKSLRAHHGPCMAHPACRQRKNRGPGYVLGHSAGIVISYEESECKQALLFSLNLQWIVQSVETMMPANIFPSRQGCRWILWQCPRWTFPEESMKGTCNMGLWSHVGNLKEILKVQE